VATNYVVKCYTDKRERGGKLSKEQLDDIDVPMVPAKTFASQFAAALGNQVGWKSADVRRQQVRTRDQAAIAEIPSSLEQEETPPLPPEADVLPWIEPTSLPQGHGAVHFNPVLGKLSFVHSSKGIRLFESLMEEYSIEQVRRALNTACAKAPQTPIENGGLEGLVRTYCEYAADNVP